jgi:O-methyltransferase involved in polyketide biosynthesis
MANARISTTAHYTSWVWVANGLAPAALGTPEGQRLYRMLRPFAQVHQALGRGPSLEPWLLTRHRLVDHLVERAIVDGAPQVVEIAAGLTARALRVHAKHPHVAYVEGDLPGMSAIKAQLLDDAHLRTPRHRTEVVDALTDAGFDAVAATLDRAAPVVIVTEGLLGYLEQADVVGLWARIARFGRQFPSATYLTDLAMGDSMGMLAGPAFQALLGVLTRSRHHRHFTGPNEATAALTTAGFDRVIAHTPGDWADTLDLPVRDRERTPRIFEATTGLPRPGSTPASPGTGGPPAP